LFVVVHGLAISGQIAKQNDGVLLGLLDAVHRAEGVVDRSAPIRIVHEHPRSFARFKVVVIVVTELKLNATA
jgi:hypothetical protein